MNVYLAARYSRREELVGYKVELEQLGIGVTSRWLSGGHEWNGTPEEALPVEAMGRFADEDLDDIDAADWLVCFTERPGPGSGPGRGGRHFEAGYAMGYGKPILVVGYRENIFYCSPDVLFAETWTKAKSIIKHQHDTGERERTMGVQA